MVSLPDRLLREIDAMVKRDSINRSELIRQAMLEYIAGRRRLELRRKMREGYLRMARLNRELAEESFAAGQQALLAYESCLVEGDKLDDKKG
ncbi:MAG TPA: ribbon-helix-helix protein, CopG family [Firmicutes bacterium]|nr:ribbon-helix-helix protein, CopG family [Bacillota bacterium]